MEEREINRLKLDIIRLITNTFQEVCEDLMNKNNNALWENNVQVTKESDEKSYSLYRVKYSLFCPYGEYSPITLKYAGISQSLDNQNIEVDVVRNIDSDTNYIGNALNMKESIYILIRYTAPNGVLHYIKTEVENYVIEAMRSAKNIENIDGILIDRSRRKRYATEEKQLFKHDDSVSEIQNR